MCHYLKELLLKHNSGEQLTLHDTVPLNTFNWLLNEEDQAIRVKLVTLGMKSIKESSTPDVRTVAALVPICKFEAPKIASELEEHGIEPAPGNVEERSQQLSEAAAIFLKRDWYKNLGTE